MKKGFTVVEVSILLVVFLIVALLVIPLSLDDTVAEENKAQWRKVQTNFSNILYAINTDSDKENFDFKQQFNEVISGSVKNEIEPYKITFLNGTYPSKTYNFNNFKTTTSNAVFAYKLYAEPVDNVVGILMYDVNGIKGPNAWGKDVFGINIYKDKYEPFCKADSLNAQKQDCSKSGTGLCCSNYYLNGGSFDR